MKAEWMGVDVRTGRHDRRLTPAEERFVGILWPEHIGLHRALPAKEVALRFAWRMRVEAMGNAALKGWKRDVRTMQNHLLFDHDGIPVLSASGGGGGYWIAENEAEADAFYETFRKRAKTGFKKATRGKRTAAVDLVQQLAFEFDELEDLTGSTPVTRPRAGTPTPVQVVDAFMERMLADPAKFADGLRKIGEKYGSVLLPKGKLTDLQAQVVKLNATLEGLAGPYPLKAQR